MKITGLWKACKKRSRQWTQRYFTCFWCLIRLFRCLSDFVHLLGSHSEMFNPPSPRWCLVISTGWINQYPTVFCSLRNWSSHQTPLKPFPLPEEGPWSTAGVPASQLERTLGCSHYSSTFEPVFFPNQNTTKELCTVYSEIVVVFGENTNNSLLLWC